MASLNVHDLNGKVAIITGSSAGIGAAIALHFVRLGASVTIHGRSQHKLESVKQQCKKVSAKNEEPVVVCGDICDEKIRVQLIEETVKRFGKLDVIVNNAGNFQGSPLSTDFKCDRLDAMLAIHLKAPFHLTKLAIPHLEKTKGNIINISSVASILTHQDITIEYSIAKAGLDRLTEVTAREMGPKAVRANCINPAAIDTELLVGGSKDPKQIEELHAMYAKQHAVERLGKVEEVASLAGFLASDSASFITGAIIPVDGGWLVK